VYHKYLPTQPTPSPPIHHLGFLPKGFYLHVYPYRVYPTVYPYSGLDANDSHLRFMQVKVKAGAFHGYLIDLVLSVHLIYPLSIPLLFTLLIDMVRAIPFLFV